MPEWDVLASKAVGIDDIGLNIPQSTQPAKDVKISAVFVLQCRSVSNRITMLVVNVGLSKAC